MELNYKVHGQGQPLIILHGVFGMLDNWQTLGKILGQHYQVFLVDQRNHGNSPHSPEFNYTVLAQDLARFIEQHQLQNPIIVGHSMGGKVAMFYAAMAPQSFKKLVVVDIAPRAYQVHHHALLEAMDQLNLPALQTRKQAEEALMESIPDWGVRAFLLKNLTRNAQKQFAWKLNLPVIRQNLPQIGQGLPQQLISQRPTLFIKGANSGYIQAQDAPMLQQLFPNSRLETIEQAGHWVHAEQPEAFMQVLTRFLQEA